MELLKHLTVDKILLFYNNVSNLKISVQFH
nr:MAG TPA: hypothetical protein [Caudoviricetes sp.]